MVTELENKIRNRIKEQMGFEYPETIRIWDKEFKKTEFKTTDWEPIYSADWKSWISIHFEYFDL